MAKKNPSVLETRRRKLRELMRKWGGPGSLAKKLGHKSGSFLSQIAGPNPIRDISEDVARGIETALELPLGWLDKENDGEPPRVEVNAPLVAEVIRHVVAAVADRPQKVQPAQIAELVTLVYEQSVTSGKIDEAYIQRLVKLMGS